MLIAIPQIFFRSFGGFYAIALYSKFTSSGGGDFVWIFAQNEYIINCIICETIIGEEREYDKRSYRS